MDEQGPHSNCNLTLKSGHSTVYVKCPLRLFQYKTWPIGALRGGGPFTPPPPLTHTHTHLKIRAEGAKIFGFRVNMTEKWRFLTILAHIFGIFQIFFGTLADFRGIFENFAPQVRMRKFLTPLPLRADKDPTAFLAVCMYA